MIILKIIGWIIIAFAIERVYSGLLAYKRKHFSKMSIKESMDLTSLPVVTFMNDGKKINFLLDTGSDASLIDESVISIFTHIKSDNISSTFGMDGNIIDGGHCNMVINYKDYEFLVDFNIVNLEEPLKLIKESSGVTIHGILGSEFLKLHKYILDFDNLIVYKK